MIATATCSTDSLGDTIELQEMAITVLAIGEWLVKQQQQLSLAQRQLEEQQRQIETLQKENEQLKDSLQKLKNRSSENSSVPPSADKLKNRVIKANVKRVKSADQSMTMQGKHVTGLENQTKLKTYS